MRVPQQSVCQTGRTGRGRRHDEGHEERMTSQCAASPAVTTGATSARRTEAVVCGASDHVGSERGERTAESASDAASIGAHRRVRLGSGCRGRRARWRADHGCTGPQVRRTFGPGVGAERGVVVPPQASDDGTRVAASLRRAHPSKCRVEAGVAEPSATRGRRQLHGARFHTRRTSSVPRSRTEQRSVRSPDGTPSEWSGTAHRMSEWHGGRPQRPRSEIDNVRPCNIMAGIEEIAKNLNGMILGIGLCRACCENGSALTVHLGHSM